MIGKSISHSSILGHFLGLPLRKSMVYFEGLMWVGNSKCEGMKLKIYNKKSSLNYAI